MYLLNHKYTIGQDDNGYFGYTLPWNDVIFLDLHIDKRIFCLFFFSYTDKLYGDWPYMKTREDVEYSFKILNKLTKIYKQPIIHNLLG